MTGETGSFIRSHILPRAFVDKNLDKTMRIEFGQADERPVIRRTGWYDEQLVTKQGEDILARYDSDAARILKDLGLCWRWFPVTAAADRKLVETESGLELIEIKGVDTAKLRLFYLSLLWRAVATRRPEFREICLEPTSKEKLRKIVLGSITGEVSDFPVILVLLTTKGQPQNITPLRQTIKMREMFGGLYADIPIFRFFLDGLIAHIGRRPLDRKLAAMWSNRVLGSSTDLVIIGRKYEGSFQDMNLLQLQKALDSSWPAAAEKIYGAIEKSG